jgi:hypothetical protein
MTAKMNKEGRKRVTPENDDDLDDGRRMVCPVFLMSRVTQVMQRLQKKKTVSE